MRVMIRFRMRAYLHVRLLCGDPLGCCYPPRSHIADLCVTAVDVLSASITASHLRRLIADVDAWSERKTESASETIEELSSERREIEERDVSDAAN